MNKAKGYHPPPTPFRHGRGIEQKIIRTIPFPLPLRERVRVRGKK
jgi:hypothetical protein